MQAGANASFRIHKFLSFASFRSLSFCHLLAFVSSVRAFRFYKYTH